MTGYHAGWLGIWVVLTFTAPTSADPPAPDPAALVRSVRAREAWIDRVDSLWLKALVTWEETPRGIAKRRRNAVADGPGVTASVDLERSRIQRTDLAFDRTRFRTSDLWPWGNEDLRVWDGKRFILRNVYEKNPEQDGYLIAGDIGNRLDHALVSIPSLQVGPRSWWWMTPERRKAIVQFAGQPEDFAYTGRDSWDGTECHVVCRWESRERHYISVTDGRLRGLKTGIQSRPDFTVRLLDYFRREGRTFRDKAGWAKWLASLPPEESRAVYLKLSANMLTLTDPIMEFGLADYREVAPACWLPMTQTVALRFIDVDGTNAVDLKKEIKIIKFQVNKPLPDSLFDVEIKEGARVIDQTHKPPLSYRHKVHFTPEEWEAIEEEAEERMQRAQARKRK